MHTKHFWLCLAMIAALVSSAAAVEPWTLTIDGVDSTKLPYVTLVVTVMDANRDGVMGLDSSHFSYTADTDPAPRHPAAQSFYDSEHGMAIVLCLDNSLTMAGKPLEDAKKAVKDYIDKLRVQDRLAIMTFSDNVETVTDFSMNRPYLKQKVDGIKATGKTTELFYAVFKAVDYLDASPNLPERHSLLVLSDGKDEGKAYKLDDCVSRANKSHVPIYTVGFTKVDESYLKNMEAMSDRTGGLYHRARTSEDLGVQFSHTLDIMKSEYLLNYLTPDGLRDLKRHQYTVTATRGNFAGQAVYALTVPPGGPSAGGKKDTTGSGGTSGNGFITKYRTEMIVVGAALLLIAAAVFLLQRSSRKKEQSLKEEIRKREEDTRRNQEEARRREEELKKAIEAQKPVMPPAASHAAPTQMDSGRAQPASRRTMVGTAGPAYTQGTLTVLNGSLQGRSFDVTRSEVTIGADPGNAIVIAEDTVSRRHATLRFAAGQFQITDNKSTNGTRVNGEPIQVTILKDGDTVRLGKSELQFRGR